MDVFCSRPNRLADAVGFLGKTFMWQKSNCWTFAKYEGGFFYLKSSQHRATSLKSPPVDI
jgi:hypothetical protein